jgi:sulfhydrogenase subunit beta (sulfur reductase)
VNTWRFVAERSIPTLLKKLPGENCYVSQPRGSGTDYGSWTVSDSPLELRGKRPTSPLKSFFLPARERVALFWGNEEEPFTTEPFSIVGLRNCDLLALQYLDRVFLEGVCEDPFYRARRETAFLISVDCLPPQDGCFCMAVGGHPYPKEGYDLNLSPVEGGYVVHIGSERGVELASRLNELLVEAPEGAVGAVKRNRASVVEHIQSLTEGLPDAREFSNRLDGTEEHLDWEPWAGKCVECGACTAACPTCHCYYLIDTLSKKPESDTEIYAKVRTWDSCLFAEYARMAGEGFKLSPRPMLRSRLANRILHKYVYSFVQYEMCGCLGCGRCDEACLGRINLRSMISAVGKRV